MKSTPAVMNWINRAPSNRPASPDRNSLEVLNVKRAPVLRSVSARAASSSSVRYTTVVAPARASATIALRFSLSSKVTTSGGRFRSMIPKISSTWLTKSRRIDNDPRSNPSRGRAGLERAQRELSEIESALRLLGRVSGFQATLSSDFEAALYTLSRRRNSELGNLPGCHPQIAEAHVA